MNCTTNTGKRGESDTIDANAPVCLQGPGGCGGDMSTGEARREDAGAASGYTCAKLGSGRQDAQQKCPDASMQVRKLPPALTDAGLTTAINELPVGARLAAETVYKCWREGKFANDEFVSFLQSIATYSPLLLQMVCGQDATHSRPMLGMAVGSSTPSACSSKFLVPAVQAVPHIPVESQAAMGINTEWRTRRRHEAARRQCAGIDGNEHQKRIGYLCRTFSLLRQQLPAAAQPALLDVMMGYSRRNTSPEAFGQQMQDLVDAYQMVAPLDYIPQRRYHNTIAVSAGPVAKRGAASMSAGPSSKGAVRGGKKSKAQVAVVPLAAVSLDEAELGRCVCLFVCVVTLILACHCGCLLL